MAKTAWKKSLGTSKREQGIITPKAPQNCPRLRNSGGPLHVPKLSLFGMVAAFFKDNTDKIFKLKRKKIDYIKPSFVDRAPGNRVKSFHRLQSQKGK